jgi:hypothetical protein
MKQGRARDLESLLTLTVGLGAGALLLGACGGGGSSTTSPCGTPDPGANFTFGDQVSGCVATADGTRADVLAFSAPAIAAGGDALIQIDDVGAGTVRATVYGPDDAKMGTFTATGAGTPLVFHLAAASAVTYRLAIDDGGGFTAPYTYRLSSTFAPIPDSFEPNDTPDKAGVITMGTPIDAFMFAGASAMAMTADAGAWDDYYQVDVPAAQPTTIRIDNVPTNLAVRLFLYRADQTELSRVATGHRGEALVMQPPPAMLAPGQYFVRVAPWAELPAAVSVGADPPDNFTRSYQLTVTQP